MASHSARIALLLVHVASARAFYLPGVSPHEYREGEQVDLKVNKLTSTKTQLPYEWYSLPFCRPEEIVSKAGNLGEVMRGDKVRGRRLRACACRTCLRAVPAHGAKIAPEGMHSDEIWTIQHHVNNNTCGFITDLPETYKHL